MPKKLDHYPLRKGFNDALGWYTPRDDVKGMVKASRTRYSITDKQGGSTLHLPYTVQISLDFDCAV